MRLKKGKEKKNLPQDPVKNFEKWKKRHDKNRNQTKRPKKKRDWEIERENIQKLVSKYAEASQHVHTTVLDSIQKQYTASALLYCLVVYYAENGLCCFHVVPRDF